MRRYRPLLPVVLALMLTACGGGEGGSTAPVDNGTTAEADLPIDTPVYDGDTPTAIDAAAKNPTATPLAPDSPVGGNAIAAEPEDATANRQD
jgi:hypothetical protein